MKMGSSSTQFNARVTEAEGSILQYMSPRLTLVSCWPLGILKYLIRTFIMQIHFVLALSLRLMNWHS